MKLSQLKHIIKEEIEKLQEQSINIHVDSHSPTGMGKFECPEGWEFSHASTGGNVQNAQSFNQSVITITGNKACIFCKPPRNDGSLPVGHTMATGDPRTDINLVNINDWGR